MLTYYLKCKNDTENVNSRVIKQKIVKQCYYQDVLHAIMKNHDL